MKDVGRVNVLQAAERLVQEGLEVCVGEGLAGTDLCGLVRPVLMEQAGPRTIACRSASMSSSCRRGACQKVPKYVE